MKKRVILLITFFIFIITSCVVAFCEKQDTYYGLSEKKGEEILFSERKISETSEFEEIVRKENKGKKIDSITVTDITPEYIPGKSDIRFYSCTYSFYSDLAQNQKLFIEYKRKLFDVGKPEEKKVGEEEFTMFDSAAVVNLNNNNAKEICFACTCNAFQYIGIFDTVTMKTEWIDCEYYVYNHGGQEKWQITVTDKRIRERTYLTIMECKFVYDDSTKSINYYTGNVIGTVKYENGGYVLNKVTDYTYIPDTDTKDWVSFVMNTYGISEDAAEYYKYIQIITSLKRYCPELDAKYLYAFYEREAAGWDSDSCDVFLFYQAPGKNAKDDTKYILDTVEEIKNQKRMLDTVKYNGYLYHYEKDIWKLPGEKIADAKGYSEYFLEEYDCELYKSSSEEKIYVKCGEETGYITIDKE